MMFALLLRVKPDSDAAQLLFPLAACTLSVPAAALVENLCSRHHSWPSGCSFSASKRLNFHLWGLVGGFSAASG